MAIRHVGAVTTGVMLRACPRCRGDVSERRDLHGTYWACLQCGEITAEDYTLKLRRPA